MISINLFTSDRRIAVIPYIFYTKATLGLDNM